MGNICLFKSKSHGSNESLMFWGFSCKILSNKTYFIDSSFPTFSLSFTRSNNFKHFSFSHRLDFLDGNIPFTSFFFSLLFDHICENFRIFLLLSIHQICWYSTILNGLLLCFSIFLLMGLYCFLHLYFLCEPLLIKKFSLNTSQCLSLFRNYFCFSCLFFSSLLLCI